MTNCVYCHQVSIFSCRKQEIYASIYKSFECAVQGYTYDNVRELSSAKYTLVEYLCGETENKNIVIESEVINTLREQEEDLRFF